LSDPYVDTDVIIRLLTGDDLQKQRSARELFEAVDAQEITLVAPDTVIADAVYVLSSPRLYAQSRAQVTAMLSRLVQMPAFKVAQRRIVLDALALYGSRNVDFGDAMVVASMKEDGESRVYSYDQDFDRFPFVRRLTPMTEE
jgi:predicted nucleic acid-binding protein